jgi:hypothetical protein
MCLVCAFAGWAWADLVAAVHTAGGYVTGPASASLRGLGGLGGLSISPCLYSRLQISLHAVERFIEHY